MAKYIANECISHRNTFGTYKCCIRPGSSDAGRSVLK